MLTLCNSLRRRPEPVSAQMVSLNVGGTLLLKACGFVEEHQARLMDITENSLTIRMGDSWLQRTWGKSGTIPTMEIHLEFGDITNKAKTDRVPHATSNLINVELRATSRSWTNEMFEDASRRMLWLLRSHFIAC